MFEILAVRSSGNVEAPLDLGALIEAAVFYGHVDLLIDPSTLKQIIRTWSDEGLVALIDSGTFSLHYRHNMTGIRTHNTGTPNERHDVIVFQLLDKSHLPAAPDALLGRAINEVVEKRGRARRLTNRLCRSLNVRRFDTGFAARVTDDLLDAAFVQRAVSDVLAQQFSGAGINTTPVFEVQRDGQLLRVTTNLDFSELTRAYEKRTGSAAAAVTPASLLTRFISIRHLLEDAAASDADIHADPIDATIAATRIQTLLTRTARNQEQIHRFQDFVVDDGRAIREAVNSGRAGVRDILRLLDSAQKFRHWLHAKDPDAELVKEYFRAVTAQTWADRLPPKAVRWALFTGVGIAIDAAGLGGIGTASGASVSAIDAFLLDRMLRGWKPNQFVEETLRPFATPPHDSD